MVYYAYITQMFSPILKKIENWFQVEEIRNSEGLKLTSFFLLLNIVFLINRLVPFLSEKKFTTYCWPFFQNCTKYQEIFLLNTNTDLRPLVYTFIFSILTYSTYSLYRENYRHFYFSLLSIFTFFILPMFILSGYHYTFFTYIEQYLFYILFIFLLTPGYRFFYLQLFFILSYFLAAISKIGSDSWLFGYLHLYGVPTFFMPFATNTVILLQILTPLLLTSKIKEVRIFCLILLEIFHIYTITIIGIGFFLITSPFVYILFYKSYIEMDFSKVYKSFFGLTIVILLVFFNIVRLVIPYEDQLTLEGSFIGFNMFHSRRGCEIIYTDKNMETKIISNKLFEDSKYCDPYPILMELQKSCNVPTLNNINKDVHQERLLKITVHFSDYSHKLVDEKNYCKLEYKAFSHNQWINTVIPEINPEKYNEKIGKMSEVLRNIKKEMQFFFFLIFIVVALILIFRAIKYPNFFDQ